MIFTNKRIELHQPNATVHDLIRSLIERQGGAVVEDVAQEAPCSDLLILDLDSREDEARFGRRAHYEAQGCPVLWTGVRVLRGELDALLQSEKEEEGEPVTETHWLERPFSPAALRAACVQLLQIEGLSDGGASEQAITRERERPNLHLGEESEEERTQELDEVALLEEEFGLEPGILGGRSASAPDESVGEATVLTSIPEEFGIEEVSESQMLEEVMQGGMWSGQVESTPLDLAVLSGAKAALSHTTSAEFQVHPTERSRQMTVPQLPSAQKEIDEDSTSAQLPSHHVMPPSTGALAGSEDGSSLDEYEDGVREEMTTGEEDEEDAIFFVKSEELTLDERAGRAFLEGEELDEEAQQEGRASLASSSTLLEGAMDEETSVELRAFSRMLAKSLSKLTLNARVEDRFEHIHRAMSALFVKGLDGAADELHRIPGVQGFSGHLRTLSLMGVFHTIRDRRLRGKLEVSSREQSYILYLDGSHLLEIDALTGDQDQLLLQILRDHQLIDEASYAHIVRTREEQGMLGPSVEMMLREARLLDDEVMHRARALRATEIFRRACQIRDGHFAFIEYVSGGVLPWPVQDLGLDVDELLLMLLRDGEVDTGISEATASAHLMPNMGRVLGLRQSVLTPAEREVLKVFEGGASLEVARKKLVHLGRELDGIINRLKRAHLLLRVEGAPHLLRTSSQQDAMDRSAFASGDDGLAMSRSEPGLESASSPREEKIVEALKRPLRTAERTVIAEIDARELDARSTQEGEAARRNDSSSGESLALFPRIGTRQDQFEVPTRSVKGHEVTALKTEVSEEDAREIDRLLKEIDASMGALDDEEEGE